VEQKCKKSISGKAIVEEAAFVESLDFLSDFVLNTTRKEQRVPPEEYLRRPKGEPDYTWLLHSSCISL
jgi:hypothetical protein